MRISLSYFLKGALAALLMFFAAFIVSVSAEVTFPKDEVSVRTAEGKTHKFSVELALTDAQRAQGLMHRKEMAPDHGMLFDFGYPRQITMWMENTILPLDMLFIQGDGSISHIHKGAVPFSRDVIDSRGPAKFVLELNAGRADVLGIKIGDKVISKRIGNQW